MATAAPTQLVHYIQPVHTGTEHKLELHAHHEMHLATETLSIPVCAPALREQL